LVEKYSEKIFALAISLLKNKEDAEEITQNTFLKAYQSLDKFREDAKFSSFLYRICYNESINQIRSRKMTLDIDNVATKDTQINDGFFHIQKKEQKKYLTLALDKLNPEYRMVLTLFYLEEQSLNEIIEITAWSLSNTKVKLHRARLALAKEINKILKNEARNLY